MQGEQEQGQVVEVGLAGLKGKGEVA